MGINLGASPILDAKLGATQVDKICLGETVVWPDSGPTVPDYGTVTYYDFTITQNSITNVVGGTVTIEDEEMYEESLRAYTYSDPAQPFSVHVSGDSADEPWNWTITAVDTNLNPVEGFMDAFSLGAITLVPDNVPFEVSFTATYKTTTIDRSITHVRVLSSVEEFASLSNDSSSPMVLFGELPVMAVKAVSIGKSITSLPNRFMRAYTNFESLDWSNADSLTTIGNSVLSECPVFNSPIIMPNSVVSIGDDFLTHSAAFNQPIVLPNSLTTIGRNFLCRCTGFNQPLNLPSTISSIGQDFMWAMGDMVNPINVGSLPASVVEVPTSVNWALTAYTSSRLAYTQGVPIVGAARASWLQAFPNSDSGGIFRKLLDGGE